MTTDTLRLLEALIACRSVTPADGGCEALLRAPLRAAGFTCESLPGGSGSQQVHNLWAWHRGSGAPHNGSASTLVLAGHTDVVPPGPLENWQSDPFVPTYRNGRLHGRGTADMKAAVAAMTVAAAEFVRQHPQHGGTVALLFTSDEEGPALHGTQHALQVLKERGVRIDACIVGEPTSVDAVGDMVVDFNFRFSTESTPEGLKARVLEVLQRHGVQHELAWTLGGMPFLTEPGTLCNALVAAIEDEFGRTPVLSTTGGTSDGRFFATHCPQVMEFGVRNDSAHKVDEWVDVAAIEPLKNTYLRTLQACLP